MSNKTAKLIFEIILSDDRPAIEIAKEKDLLQISDEKVLTNFIAKTFKDNAKIVVRYEMGENN